MMKKRRTRLLSMVLVLAMLLTMMPVSALAGDTPEEPATSGSCGKNGDNVTWNFSYDTGILTIDGTGEMNDYSTLAHNSTPWKNFCEEIKQVVIQTGVTTIGGGSFISCSNLETVNIATSIQSIGRRAFESCVSIKQIDLSQRIHSIEDAAFKGCTGLSSITLPNALSEVENYTFDGCSSLQQVIFPEKLEKIGDSSFSDCTQLKNVIIPNNVNSIGEWAFKNCTSIESIIIPENISHLALYAFSGCDNLKNLTIPASISYEYGGAFDSCNAITYIKLTGNGPMGKHVPGATPWYGSSVEGNQITIEIENGVTSISENAFQNCSGLKKIIIPQSVTQIASGAFENCTSLQNIALPNDLHRIEDKTFSECTGLTNIKIPDSVTTIGDYAFSGCESLTSITIPDSVTSIGNLAFNGCDSLTDVYYAGSETKWETISIGSDNENLTNATIHYNSTGPDDPGTGDSESGITSMVALFTSYDESKKQATFGATSTSYTYQITDETVLPEGSINSLIDKTVLVRYKTGDYGASDMLTCYVLSISPAVAASGILSKAEQGSIILGDTTYSLDRTNGTAALGDLEAHIGDFIVCYFYDNAIVDVRFPQKQTGTLVSGTEDSVTIDGVKYPVAFTDSAPYLSAIDLWFNQTVEYWIADGIIYDIQLPDYETAIYKRLEKIQDNKAYFHDGSSYQIIDNSAIDTSLAGRWVAVTLTTSADGGTMLSNMTLLQPQISVEIAMVDDRNIRLKDDKYSYDGSDYVPSSQFEIGYQITIESKVPGVSGSDLVLMQADPTMALTLNDLEIAPPNGFNSGWTGSGEIPNVSGTTILPGQTKVGKGFVRPGMLYFVDKEDISVMETIQMKLETSVGDYEGEVSFTIMNLNYEPPKTKEEALNSRETKELIEKAANELDKLDVDSGIMITDPALVKSLGIDDKNLTRLKKDLLTEVIMSSAPEDSLSDQITDNMMSKVFGEYKSPVSGSMYTVPLRYVFETPNYGMLTVQFTCNINSFTLNDSKYALYATVDYEVLQQDKDSGDKTWPSYKKGDFAQIAFADVKAYTDAAYDVAKEAIKGAYDEAWGNQADQIADFLFDDVVKAVLEASNTSFSEEVWKIMTWPTENMSVACPVDIFIYDENGDLCGSIEGDQVTKTSAEFGLSVSGDVKYVTGLRDDYKVLYKATGNGSMDIAITEYTGYESPLRAVTFKAVPLVQDGTYTQGIAGEVLADVNSYKLIPDVSEEDILPDDKVVLIGLTSDETEQEETPDPVPEPTPSPEPDTNSGGGSGSSGSSSGGSTSSNRYTVSVPTDIDNGSISVSPSRAERGDTVTITVKPDEGYKLHSLIALDSDGDRITIEKERENIYTFEMPSDRVTIEATFAEIEEQPTSLPFNDVSAEAYYADAVLWAVENDITNGTTVTTFSPNASCTRAQMVTFLWRAAGSPEPKSTENPFTDVASNVYYTDAVLWAVENGITNGTSATTFNPETIQSFV